VVRTESGSFSKKRETEFHSGRENRSYGGESENICRATFGVKDDFSSMVDQFEFFGCKFGLCHPEHSRFSGGARDVARIGCGPAQDPSARW
jgi:hypothetical protein